MATPRAFERWGLTFLTKHSNLSKSEWDVVRRLFHDAVECQPAERDIFISSQLSDQPHLMTEVLSLLQFHNPDDSFLSEPPHSATLLKALNSLASPRAHPGDTIGDFKITREIGRGSFAGVYLARQISLDRDVAVKISPDIGNEAKTMAPLEHDHIVRVFSETTDRQSEMRILCMQYVPGISLEKIFDSPRDEKWLTGHSLIATIDHHHPDAQTLNPVALKDREFLEKADALETALWLALRLADALAYAHDRGILHLDVKPANILMNPYGRPLLTDFNVAAKTFADKKVEITGGTLRYMAPEHLGAFQAAERGKQNQWDIDGRADIYSLGILLQEMLDKSPGIKIPESVARLIGKATAADATNRFPNARLLASSLEWALERHVIERELPEPDRVMRATLRYPWISLLAFMLIPNLLGSFVNISYNSMMIVSALTLEQQLIFQRLLFILNPVIYIPCFLIIDGRLRFIRHFIRDPQEFFSGSSLKMTAMRNKLIHTPGFVLWVTAAGWATGCILFPLSIHALSGPLSGSVFGHFFISFFLSCMVALTYSYLYSQFLVLRVLYPYFFSEGSQIRVTARIEIASFWKDGSFFQYLAGVVPLFSTLMLIVTTPLVLKPGETLTFRILIFAFSVMALSGTVIAVRVSRVMAQTIMALTGQR